MGSSRHLLKRMTSPNSGKETSSFHNTDKIHWQISFPFFNWSTFKITISSLRGRLQHQLALSANNEIGWDTVLAHNISTMQSKFHLFINVTHWFSYFRHYHTWWKIQESGQPLTAPSTKLQNIFFITLTYHFNTFLDHSWTLHIIAVLLLFFLKKGHRL